jgi:hypothetical protein
VTIALDQTGTWAADNTLGLYVAWALYAGTTFKTPADLWTAGSFYSVTGTSSTMNVNGSIFELFDVSLTEGSVAPPFQVPDYASELALCQRYYNRISAGLTTLTSLNLYYSVLAHFPVTMRAQPTVAFVQHLVSLTAFATPFAELPTAWGFRATAQANVNAANGTWGALFSANARL